MRNLTHFAILALALSACAKDEAKPAASVHHDALMPFAEAPDFALSCVLDDADEFFAIATYTNQALTIEFGGSATQQISLSGIPQGLQFGDAAGDTFLIVVLTDFVDPESEFVKYTETNGQFGNPVTIGTAENRQLYSLALHTESGTAFIADGGSGEILRVPDTDTDGVPDVAQMATFADGNLLGTLQIKELTPASASSVWVRGRGRTKIEVVDTDGDGVADLLRPQSSQPGGNFGVYLDGDDDIAVKAHDDSVYSIFADAPAGPELLATFTGTGSSMRVSLSRALVAGEPLFMETANGEVVAQTAVLDQSDLFISGHEAGTPAPSELDEMKITGKQITGNEVVEAVRGSAKFVGDIVWTPVEVTDHTDTSLTVIVPDLEISTIDTVIFRVTSPTGQRYEFGSLVREQE